MSVMMGDAKTAIRAEQLEKAVLDYLHSTSQNLKRVLIIPPDHTRLNSRAGEITSILYQALHENTTVHIMPALGTHFPMTRQQCVMMFGEAIPESAYLAHDWRNGLEILGEISTERIRELSEGKVDFSVEVGVNRQLLEGSYDLILSIGQVVPHEVIGMANYTKNILVGVGGGDTIHKSHYLGAVYGMERIMGKTQSPVRFVLNEGYDQFVRPKVNLHYMLTVIGKEDDELVMRGLFMGQNDDVFESACELSREVNLDRLTKPIQKCVVYLDPSEFNSTWLGNKAVYRTRKAIATGGELVILAPDLHTFGEDPEIDRLIRKHGYFGTDDTLKRVEEDADLRANLSAAAHLIHGTSDGRFNITYCTGGKISKAEVESVGYQHQTYDDAIQTYNPETLKDGWNTVDGEDIFYISNPALGLWEAVLD